MKSTRGFTLIEMMIVVAIIAIVAAIAIPGLIRSRLQTNEGAAIENLRTVCGAELGFNSVKCVFGDFGALTSEVDGTGTAYLNGNWADGVERQGYRFFMDTVSDGYFVCFADPKTPGVTGNRWFRVDPSGLIRYNAAARPSDVDPVIGSSS